MSTFDELLRAWCDAEARADASALDRILASDFRGDGPDGFVLGKQAWLDRHRCHELTLVSFSWLPTRVWIGAGTAIAIGTQTQVGRYRGRDCSGVFACTLVGVRRGVRWSLVNLQLARMAP